MSVSITEAYVTQYRDRVHELVQQKTSRLRRTVRNEIVTGESKFTERVSGSAAVARGAVHAPTAFTPVTHSRRFYVMQQFEWSERLHPQDKNVLTLIDPTNAYTRAGAQSLGRTMDDVIVSAATGTALSGHTGATPVSFPASQRVAVNYVEVGSPTDSNLTMGKVRRAKAILDGNEADDEGRFAIVSASALMALLRDSTVTSSDYNTVKALMNGELNTWMGFTWIRSQRLGVTAGNVRSCLFYQMDGIELGMALEPMARINERPDLSNAIQIWYAMTLGATRIEEERVVEVLADEDL